MRNPDRIKPFCDDLAAVWEKFPDWRFGQFIVNVFNTLPFDPFFLEDFDMLKLIQSFGDEANERMAEENH